MIEHAQSTFLAGLLFGSGYMHFLRLKVMPDDPQSRKYIALSGFALYWFAGLLCMQPWLHLLQVLGVCIAVLGPVLGFSAVLGSGNRPDTYQIEVGWFQLCGLVVGVAILIQLWS